MPASAKTCAYCHQDCSDKPRLKDAQGVYFCKECYPQAQAEAKARAAGSKAVGNGRGVPLSGAGAGSASSVFDDPIVLSPDMVPTKDEPKQVVKKVEDSQSSATKNCESCGIMMPAKAVVCTNCGFNTGTKKGLKTKIQKALAAPKEKGAVRASSGEYAGFLLRAGAAMIDGIMIFVIAFASVFIAVALQLIDPKNWDRDKIGQGEIPNDLLMVIAAVYVLWWLYFALQESSGAQATLGKRAAGIAMSTVNGGPVGFLRSSGRYWIKFILYGIPGVSLIFIVANCVMVVVTSRKQALHDLVTGVVVSK